jgi:hypothetical protein
MDNKKLIVCPNCAKKLSVPTDQGALQITCPSCRATWEQPPAIQPAELGQMLRQMFGNAEGDTVLNVKSLFEKARIPDTDKRFAKCKEGDGLVFEGKFRVVRGRNVEPGGTGVFVVVGADNNSAVFPAKDRPVLPGRK